ncbi:MAG TPA: hypothetical protein VJ748_05425 [Vitreimonas sp.]|nr:hypothetical protein [Vitreimonas sp.]
MNAADRLRLVDADFEEIGDQRRSDRRQGDRRAQRMRLDAGFAATLINQIAKPELIQPTGYAKEPNRLRPGAAFDLRA